MRVDLAIGMPLEALSPGDSVNSVHAAYDGGIIFQRVATRRLPGAAGATVRRGRDSGGYETR